MATRQGHMVSGGLLCKYYPKKSDDSKKTQRSRKEGEPIGWGGNRVKWKKNPGLIQYPRL